MNINKNTNNLEPYVNNSHLPNEGTISTINPPHIQKDIRQQRPLIKRAALTQEELSNWNKEIQGENSDTSPLSIRRVSKSICSVPILTQDNSLAYITSITKISSSDPQEQSNENTVNYSGEEINISDPSESEVLIPGSGSFEAGSRLCSELSRNLFQDMCHYLTKNTQKSILDQTKIDIGRSNDFVLKDEKGNITSIKHPEIIYKDLSGEKAIKDLTEFFTESPDLLGPIGSIANQGLQSTCMCLYSQAPLRSESKKESHQQDDSSPFITYSAEGSIGFPSPSTFIERTSGAINYIGYEIEKIDVSHFRVTSHMNTGSLGFLLKKENQPSELTQIRDGLEQACSSTIQVSIKRNINFDTSKPISEENAPCSLAVTKLQNLYDTFEKHPSQHAPQPSSTFPARSLYFKNLFSKK